MIAVRKPWTMTGMSRIGGSWINDPIRSALQSSYQPVPLTVAQTAPVTMITESVPLTSRTLTTELRAAQPIVTTAVALSRPASSEPPSSGAVGVRTAPRAPAPSAPSPSPVPAAASPPPLPMPSASSASYAYEPEWIVPAGGGDSSSGAPIAPVLSDREDIVRAPIAVSGSASVDVPWYVWAGAAGAAVVAFYFYKKGKR